jgi:hypothetical protein
LSSINRVLNVVDWQYKNGKHYVSYHSGDFETH